MFVYLADMLSNLSNEMRFMLQSNGVKSSTKMGVFFDINDPSELASCMEQGMMVGDKLFLLAVPQLNYNYSLYAKENAALKHKVRQLETHNLYLQQFMTHIGQRAKY